MDVFDSLTSARHARSATQTVERPPPGPGLSIPVESPAAAPPDDDATPAAVIYVAAVERLLPRLRQILQRSLDPFGPLLPGRRAGRTGWTNVTTQAAAVAVAAFLSRRSHHPEEPGLRHLVRAALIRWQLSLRGDGLPASGRGRRSALTAPAFAMLMRIVADRDGYRDDALLRDIDAHARWLMRQPAYPPWSEAHAIGALCDASGLVRNQRLLENARCRLRRLLTLQDAEGWFPARGGADVSLHSLLLDALGRVFVQHRWEELLQPLNRAAAFLEPFALLLGGQRRAHSLGGVMSAYGVELLAAHAASAARIVAALRPGIAAFDDQAVANDADEWCAIRAAGLALAGSCATGSLEPSSSDATDQTSRMVTFPRAGLTTFGNDSYTAVVNRSAGGALEVEWNDARPPLRDAGAAIVLPRRMCHAARGPGRAVLRVSERRVVIDVALRSVRGRSDARWDGMVRTAVRLLRRLRGLAAARFHGHRGATSSRRKPPFRLRRTITFAERGIEICDRVWCGRSCEAVVVPAPVSPAVTRTDRLRPVGTVEEPLYFPGGRVVEITRTYQQGVLVRTRFRRLRRRTRRRRPVLGRCTPAHEPPPRADGT